jgi:cell division septation protein DedD
MALVLVYALGVERGKATARSEVKRTARAPLQSTKVMPKEAKAAVQQPAAQQVAVEQPSVRQPATAAQEGKPYTILVDKFRQKPPANEELWKLKGEGYNAFLVETGDYLELCIGKYASFADASRLQKNLSARYKKCYIKKLQ